MFFFFFYLKFLSKHEMCFEYRQWSIAWNAVVVHAACLLAHNQVLCQRRDASLHVPHNLGWLIRFIAEALPKGILKSLCICKYSC